jgi:hypothetical protein
MNNLAPRPEFLEPRRRPSAVPLRRQVLQSLVMGLMIQAALTGLACLALKLRGTPFTRFSGNALLLTSVLCILVPAWVGSFFSGYRARRIRGYQLMTFGALPAAVFLLLTNGPPSAGGLVPILRFWLAANLVLDPAITGLLGHWYRERRAARSLEPRPWRRSR